MALTLWPSLYGVPIGNGPIFTAMSASIVMTELGQFSNSSVTLPAADARAVAAMAPFTLLEIVQDGLGTIGYGYVLNPRQQVTDNDDDTITLDLQPLTVECVWRTTRRGWNAANTLSVIAARLGSLVPGTPSLGQPGWSGVFTGKGTEDITVSVSLDSPTVLGGFLQVAKQFAQYARLGVDATGAPTRVLEMGQFGASPSVTLVSADGADPDAIAANGTVAAIATVDRQPNDVSQLVNFTVPFGGGSGDALVTLERLWRIIHDPTYPNYGKYGAVAGSVFPEYDPNYPIEDPTTKTRAVTLDGHYDYPVYDLASLGLYGFKEGVFVDSGLTYTDSSPANQELTQIALYLQTIANFKRFAHPHETFACTTAGIGRPTRAGDLIAVDYQRVSVNENGAVVEMNVQENLRVMAVVRQFQGDAVPVDTYTLSNLGRFDETDASGTADTARTLVALQLRQETSIAKDSVVLPGNLDALNPLTLWHFIAAGHFRYHQVRVRCDFYPYRATAQTATNSDATITVTGIDHGSHTFPQTNTQNAAIAAMPTHRHIFPFAGINGGVPAAESHWLGVVGSGDTTLFAAGASGRIETSPGIVEVNLTPTAHPHTMPQTTVAPEHTTLSGPLPQHTHPLDQRIPAGPSPVWIRMDINGQSLTTGAASTGTRTGPGGAFTGSFVVDDIGPYLDAYPPGTDVPITFNAGTNASNPYGVGYLVVTVTSVEELGGLASNVFIAQ